MRFPQGIVRTNSAELPPTCWFLAGTTCTSAPVSPVWLACTVLHRTQRTPAHNSTAIMDETRRRRRPSFALGAIVALLAAGNCVAFVAQPYTGATGNKNAKLAAGSTRISRSVAPVDHRKQHRQQQRSVATAASARRRISRTSLAGAVDPNAELDHFDGWNPTPGTNIGTVSLVGSGPGDPDLLTVSGLRELQSADLVIADRLVSKEILGLVSCGSVCVVSHV